MKLKFILLASIIMLSGYGQQAKAQFWKKWFQHEEQKPVRKKPVKPIVPNNKEDSKVRTKRLPAFPKTNKKERYRMDVLCTLYLNDLVKDNKPSFKGRTPEKAVNGIEFYEGTKLAADTLSGYGYDVDIYIHDITDSSSTIDDLFARKTLDSSDLIIGVLPSQYLQKVAAHAKETNINFISAQSPSDADVKNNPYFILLQPTFESHCEHIKDVIDKKYARKKPVVFYRTSVNMDDIAYSYFSDEPSYQKLLCNTMPDIKELAPLFDSMETNLIIMPILDVAYAEKILTKLNELFPNYNIDVYGMPSWEGMKITKKADATPNIAVHYTSGFYYDISTASGQAVASRYKNVSGNNIPSEMVFRGYETITWYAYLLNRYGTIFNEKLGDNGAAPFTAYDIKPKWDDDHNFLYFENKHLYLYRYQNGSYMVESE